MNKTQKGILYASLTAVISGFSILYSKFAVVKMDPLVLTTSRNLFVGLLFIFLITIMGGWGEVRKLGKKQTLSLGIIALIGGAIPFYLFFSGLKLISALTANIIHKSMFVWAGALAVIMLKEKISLPFVLGFGAIVISQLIIGGLLPSISAGSMMVLGATLFWSLEQIIAKKTLESVSPRLVGLARMGGGSLFLLFATAASGKLSLLPFHNPSQLLTVGISGALLFFYVYFWFKALSLAPVTVVSLVLTGATVVGALLTGLFVPLPIPVKDMAVYTGILGGIAVAVSAAWYRLGYVGDTS